MHKHTTRLICLLLLLLLNACVSRPLTPIDNLKHYQAKLAAEDQWQVSGKIVMRSAGEAEKARVNWQNNGDDYKIRMSGTLGMGTTYIYGTPQQVRLEQSGKQPVVAATPEELILEQLGQDIPVSNLRYWIRGLPSPSSKIKKEIVSNDGTLASLQQDGWLLTYSDYTAVGQWNLPSQLTATRDDILLTVDMSKWYFPEAKSFETEHPEIESP